MSKIKETINKLTVGKIICSSLFIVILIVIDQVTKLLVSKNITYGHRRIVIDNFFSLHYVRNTGSAFSFLADKPWGIYVLSAFSLIVGILIILIGFYSIANDFNFIGYVLLLVSSGAIGNLIDRFSLHYVIDFLRFDFGNYTFPIFNFADICAVVGTILVIFIIIFKQQYFDKYWNLLFEKGGNNNEEKTEV